jgi:hypothetical protein
MSDALVLPVILRTGVVRLGPERFEIEWRTFFFWERKKPRPCPWRGGDFFAVTTWPGPMPQKALSHMHKSGMPMAPPALNMERPWNGKDRAAAMRAF